MGTSCKHTVVNLWAKIATGTVWLVMPSTVMLIVGLLAGPSMGWSMNMVYLSCTTAFITWVTAQITFLGCLRHIRRIIRADIEAYHDEFVALRYWTTEPGSPKTDLNTLKSLKQKLLASTHNAGS
jgi:hypothetical protein